jgi:hypothetical protein
MAHYPIPGGGICNGFTDRFVILPKAIPPRGSKGGVDQNRRQLEKYALKE